MPALCKEETRLAVVSPTPVRKLRGFLKTNLVDQRNMIVLVFLFSEPLLTNRTAERLPGAGVSWTSHLVVAHKKSNFQSKVLE